MNTGQNPLGITLMKLIFIHSWQNDVLATVTVV